MAVAPGDRAREVRRTLIDVSRRRQKPGSGSNLALTDWSDMTPWPDLSTVLRGLRWAIAGAVATRQYMPERSTRDLDVVVLTDDTEVAGTRLAEEGFTRLGALSIGGSAWRIPGGQELDLIAVGGSRWVEALSLAAENADPGGSPVLTLPHLVLMKLEAGRLQAVADVSRMLGFADEQGLAAVRAVIARYAPAMQEDLESLIELGKIEHESG